VVRLLGAEGSGAGEVTMTIHLTDEECAVLRRVVDHTLRELRVEIHHTHDSEMRSLLLHRETVYRHILGKLAARVPAVANV
jgi:hypothetical protein